MATEKETLEKVQAIEKVSSTLEIERNIISNKIGKNNAEIHKLSEALKDEVALYSIGVKFIKDNVEELTITHSNLHWESSGACVISYRVKGRDSTTSYTEREITKYLKDKSWKCREKGDFALGKSIMIKRLGKTGENYYGITHKGTMLVFEDIYGNGNLEAKMGDGNYRLIQNKRARSWRLVRVKSKAELAEEAKGSQSWRRYKKTVTVSWRLTIKQSCISKEDQVEHLL